MLASMGDEHKKCSYNFPKPILLINFYITLTD